MRPPRLVLMVAVCSLLLGLATACSGDKATLTIYTSREQRYLQPILDKFSKTTGTKLTVKYGTSTDLAHQLTSEGAKGPADVFLAQDAIALDTVAKAGLFTELPDATLKLLPAAYHPADKLWAGVAGREIVLTYNVNRVPIKYRPHSVFELTKRVYEGGVGVSPTDPVFATVISSMLVQQGEPATKAFLAGLVKNKAQARADNKALVDDVTFHRGIYLGITTHYAVYDKTRETGAAVDLQPARLLALPASDPTSLMTVAGIGVLAGAKDNPQARKLVEYLMGAEVQKYFAETFEYPLLPSVAPDEKMPLMTNPKVDISYLSQCGRASALIAASGLGSGPAGPVAAPTVSS